MHIVVYRQQRPWSDPWEEAFVEGLTIHGVPHEVRSVSSPVPCDLAVFWSHRHTALMRQARMTYLVLERGFFRRREFASLGYGGLNGHACWVLPGDSPGDRWERYGPGLRSWRGDLQGRWIIAGQVSGDASILHVDIGAWCAKVQRQLAAVGIAAEIRRHPLDGGGGRQPPIEHDLAEAAVLFTYNSNAGVDAMIAGVPTVAADPGSMVWDVAERRWIDDSMAPLAEPPLRRLWAHELAYKQWGLGEIASGEAWEHVQPRCKCCGGLHRLDFAADPYASEVHGDDSPVWGCDPCRRARAWTSNAETV